MSKIVAPVVFSLIACSIWLMISGRVLLFIGKP